MGLMIVWWGSFRELNVWEFIGQLIRFMDESWQALWTDVKFLALEFQVDERPIHFGRAAIKTNCV